MSQLSIQQELAALATKMSSEPVQTPDSQLNPFAPVLDTQGNPLSTPVAPPAVETTPAAQVTPVVAPVAPVVPQEQVASGLIQDWDAQIVTPVIATTDTPLVPVQPDFTEIAKALGKEKISDVQELVQEIQQLKSNNDVNKGVPEDLAEAMRIAKLGGDYLEFLKVKSVDWNKQDPIVLYETYVEDQYYDPKTDSINYEAADKVLEKLTDEEKEFKGRELQRQYVAYQKQQTSYIEQSAAQKKVKFESSVRDALQSINDVNGFVLTPTKKSELLQYVLSGEDLKENDVRSRLVNAFIKKNFQAIDSYMKTKIKNTVTRDILAEAQVPEIRQPGQRVDEPTKAYNIQDYIQDLKKNKGF